MYYVELLVAGLLAGAAYSLSALGIVVIYKGSGVLNFAQGSVGMVATYVYANARHGGKDLGVSLLLGLGTAAVLGLAIYLLVMRPLRHSPPSVRMVASFAVLLILQGIGELRWGNITASVPYPIKQHNYHWHGVTIGTNDILSIGIAVLITIGLSVAFRVTTAGRATEAAALSEKAAMRLGYRVNLLAAGTWVLGSVLAGVGGILIAPSIGLTITNLTLIMIAAFAAALVGGFRSLGITAAAAFGIGAVESLLTTAFITQPGWSQAVPFFVIVLVLAVRGSGIPSRIEAISERLPLAPYPRFSWRAIVFSAAALIVFPLILNPFWQLQSQAGVGLAIVVVSLVPLTGYLGQISLMQWGVAGAGAFLAGALATNSGVPMLLHADHRRHHRLRYGHGDRHPHAAHPGHRRRNRNPRGWHRHPAVAARHVLGHDRAHGPAARPVWSDAVQRQFLYVSEVILGIVVLAIWLLRRGAYGQHLLAARASERAAAACGLRTGQLKLWTFGISCAIAAIGGGLYGFGIATLNTQTFDPVTSTQLLAFAFHQWHRLDHGCRRRRVEHRPRSGVSQQCVARPGFVVVQHPRRHRRGDHDHSAAGRRLREVPLPAGPGSAGVGSAAQKEAVGGNRPGRPRRPGRLQAERSRSVSAAGTNVAAVEVDDVKVAFGGVTALRGVSMHADQGDFVGVIGANGAGKTVMFDVISGFTRPTAGSVRFFGETLGAASAARRARMGLRRTFQSAELFDDLSVWENVSVGATDHNAVEAILAETELEAWKTHLARDVPAGLRRRVDLARAIAGTPTVLLLDEPGAGLGGTEVDGLVETLHRICGEREMTIIVVEHDMSLIKRVCNRVYVLDFGSIIAEGTPEEIIASPVVQKAYLGEIV